MILEIKEKEFYKNFFLLFAEAECGKHFDKNNPSHNSWARRRISIHYFRGVRFFGSFDDGNKPVGFVAVLLDEGPEGISCFGQSAEILDIAVASELRGKGHGKELLRYAESFARESGAYCLGIFTTASDQSAISFYGKNGFVPVATIPDVHGPGDEGKVWMRKILGR